MTRLAILAPKTHQASIIDALHESKLAHIEAYNRDENEDSELDIGSPLPSGSRASETLVQIRSLIHTLGLESESPERQIPVATLRDRVDNELPQIREDVREAANTREKLQKQLGRINDRIQALTPLQGLPLRLEDYRGYEAVEPFVGYVNEGIEAGLNEAFDRYEHFASERAHAIFVPQDQAEDAQEILARYGFQPVDVPEGEGSVQQLLTDLETEASDLQADLEQAQQRLRTLAHEHKDLLLCAEEDLSIVVEKAEAPLDFASTERTFIIDTWVPSDQVDTLKSRISEAANGQIHFETLDDGGREDHHREEKPPTRYDHPTGVKPFSFLMDTFSTPKYDEIDPTIILTLVFPLFFGFMIGDLGYGLLMIALGFYLWRTIGARVEAARGLGFSLFLAGIWAALFGGIVFRDALGIPLYVDPGHLTWPGLLGLPIGLGEPMIHKLAQSGVRSMLALSILAAFVHLFIGFLFSFINHLGHDVKHALAQVGWTITLTGLFLLTLLMGPANAVSGYLIEAFNLGVAEWTGHGVEALHFTSFAQMLPWYVLAPGIVTLIATEGFMGVMETFSLLSNIISYTRLAGVAVAKGAMALAFNGIFLEDMVLHGEGTVLLVVGFLLFVLAQLLVFALGMISSGIQGIRLNYVEFFLKFFEGGGEAFSPFGRERRFTLQTDTR